MVNALSHLKLQAPRAMKPVVLAFAFVFAGSAMIDAGDWVLYAPSDPLLPAICAKDQRSCEAAVEAIGRGWLDWPFAYRSCMRVSIPCFTESSNCVVGWNCR